MKKQLFKLLFLTMSLGYGASGFAQEYSENNATSWTTFADDAATTSVTNNQTKVKEGSYSILFQTQSGFGTGLKYPAAANWNFNASTKDFLSFWVYGDNPNAAGFQDAQPVVTITTSGGSYTYTPNQILVQNGTWVSIVIPLAGDANWTRTSTGTPNLNAVNQVQLKFDTWDYGFKIYVDGFRFGLNPAAYKLKVCDDGIVKKDSEEKLTVALTDQYGAVVTPSLNATLTSSNTSVVNVGGGKILGGAAAGTATITASAAGLSVAKSFQNITTASVNAPVKVVKIALFIEDFIEPVQNKRWHQIFGWFDPLTLANRVVDSLERASNYTVDFQIVKTVQATQSFVRINGTMESVSSLYNRHVTEQAKSTGRYSDYSYDNHLYNTLLDYNAFFTNYNIPSETNAGQYSEVWIYSHPIGGFYEANMAGPNDKLFNLNGGNVYNTGCNSIVNIMGLNYERNYELAIHSFGHRVEGTMKQVYGAWDFNTSTPSNDFEKFTLIDLNSPGNGEVGRIHFPFNGRKDYNYDTSYTCSTNHSHWFNYPSVLVDNKATANCALYGCSEAGYMMFWFKHLPRYTGIKNGVLNDWWRYAVDFYGAQAYAQTLQQCSVSGNTFPTVSLSSPTTLVYTAPASVTLTANAADVDGTITKVNFYAGSTRLFVANASPFTYNWTGVAAGTYILKAVAYDNSGDSTASATVSITVNPQGGTCTAATWNATTAYSGGAVVQYGGIKYVANWWTQNQRPDLNSGAVGSGQPWTSQGTCTSRLSNEVFQELVLVPNPASAQVTVQTNEEVSGVALYDLSGSKKLESAQGTFDVTGLSTGIYFVKIVFVNGEIVTRKLLVK